MTVKPAVKDEYIRLLAKMSDDAPVSITVHDFDGKTLYANRETLRLHGFNRREFSAKNLHEIDAPESEKLIAARMQQVLEKGEADFEVRHFRKDGSIIPLHTNAKILDWGERKVLLSIATSLTGQKEAEEQLKRATINWQSTFDSMQDATCLFDADQRITMCNRTMQEMVGAKNADELIGRHCWEVVHGIKEPIPDCPIVRMRVSLKRETKELQIGDHWYVVTVDPIFDEKQMLVGAVHNIRDITKRKEAEEKLKKTEAEFSSLISNSADIIAVLDPNGDFLFRSPSFYTTLGFKEEKAGIKNAFELIHPDDAPRARKTMQLSGKHPGKIHSIELRMHHEDNSWRIMDLIGTMSSWGKQDRVIIINGRDITDRKMAEEAQQASETRYRRLFETAQDGILILDADTGQIVEVNPYFIKMLGFSREQFLGKKIWEIGLFKDIVANTENFEKLQKKKYMRYENLPIETAEGRTISVEFVSNVYKVNEKKVIQCNIRDITDRKLAEEAQQASETRYRRLFETAQDGILILDADTGQIVEVNPYFIKMLGFSREQFLGKKIWEIGLFKDIVANTENFEKLQKKKYMRYENLPIETAEGRTIAVEFVSNVYKVNEKKVIQCNIRDITDRKLAEDQIQILNKKLTAEGIALKKAQNKLQILNTQLEKKVKKRTAELEKVNLILTERNLTLQIMNAGTRALLIVQEEAGFIPQICNDLIRIGGYSHVWLAGINTEGKIGIVATAGDEYPGFSKMLTEGQLPACTDLIRKAGGVKIIITPDPACADCPLSRLHTDCFTIIVRLDAGEKIIGLLGVTLPPGVSPTNQETERIGQIAQEIAFIILYLRTKAREQAAYNQITKNLEQLAILNDHIRNPLQGIVGYAGMGEGELFTKIIELSMEIDSIVAKLDQRYLESKKIRDFMELHEHITYKPDITYDIP